MTQKRRSDTVADQEIYDGRMILKLGPNNRTAGGAKRRRSSVGVGEGGGRSIPESGSGGLTPGKTLKFYIENVAIWCILNDILNA